MQEKTISKISKSVIQFFSCRADKASKATNFVRRKDKAKLTAASFCKVVTLGCLSDKTMSLEKMCLLFKEEGIKISKQGLDQRFNAQATALMKVLFEESLERFKAEQSSVIDLLKCFSGVKLLDSSTIGLPPQMKKLYRGCGGGGPESSLKIQALYNYVNGQLDDITITDGRKNDQSFKGHLDSIERDALYLQDLGYFDAKSFAALHEHGAYFISRHFNQTGIYDEQGQRIDLVVELRKAGSLFTRNVLIGRKHKVPVRLIAHRLPEEVVEKRLRHTRENARRHGKTPKQETLEMVQWSVCITNVPQDMLQDEHIYLLYSLRWQIELIFKLCKQEAGVDKITSKKADRVLCQIYAKLICVAMLLHLCMPVRWQGEQELSFRKAYNCLRKQVASFFKALNSLYRMKLFLKKFMSDLQDFAMKSIKRKQPATHQKLMGATGQKVLA